WSLYEEMKSSPLEYNKQFKDLNFLKVTIYLCLVEENVPMINTPSVRFYSLTLMNLTLLLKRMICGFYMFHGLGLTSLALVVSGPYIGVITLSLIQRITQANVICWHANHKLDVKLTLTTDKTLGHEEDSTTLDT
ncbi:hypothetical protein ACJX0J_029856, partial [Zea mays]